MLEGLDGGRKCVSESEIESGRERERGRIQEERETERDDRVCVWREKEEER